jgi:hypothetical protein
MDSSLPPLRIATRDDAPAIAGLAASRRIYEQLGFSAHAARWNGNQVFLRLNLA